MLLIRNELLFNVTCTDYSILYHSFLLCVIMLHVSVCDRCSVISYRSTWSYSLLVQTSLANLGEASLSHSSDFSFYPTQQKITSGNGTGCVQEMLELLQRLHVGLIDLVPCRFFTLKQIIFNCLKKFPLVNLRIWKSFENWFWTNLHPLVPTSLSYKTEDIFSWTVCVCVCACMHACMCVSLHTCKDQRIFPPNISKNLSILYHRTKMSFCLS